MNIQIPNLINFIRQKNIFLLVIFSIVITSLVILITTIQKPKSYFIQGKYNLEEENKKINSKNANPTLFTVHFFDWFHSKNIQGITNEINLNPIYQTHTIDWNNLGILTGELGSLKYYDNNFKLIKDAGIDSITWEFYKLKNGNLTIPSTEAIQALKNNNLKIGIFYDWELIHASGKAQLSQEAYINPTQDNIDTVSDEICKFYSGIPNNLWFINHNGQLVIFIYAFGYNKESNDLEKWNTFYTNLNTKISDKLNISIKIYLTGTNVIQQETAFINFPDKYEPFNFVLDQPQQLFGNDIVTWNFGFDSYGAAKRDDSRRMLRLDNRYWQEMFDLVKKQQPQIVFMYSWNEPFEGSTLIPAVDYKYNRINFVKEMITNIKYTPQATDKTLTIIDDYPKCIISNDWHCSVEKDFMLYHLKRFFPESDVLMTNHISLDSLKKYNLIIDLATYKNDKIENALISLPPETKIVYFDPLQQSSQIKQKFLSSVKYQNLNYPIKLNISNCPDTTLFARDDIANIQINNQSNAILKTIFPSNTIIVKNDNDYFINSYSPNYCTLKTLAQNLYSRPMENEILYGEGTESQNLVIEKGSYKTNYFYRPGILQNNLYIPNFLQTFPKEMNKKYNNFIYFGKITN